MNKKFKLLLAIQVIFISIFFALSCSDGIYDMIQVINSPCPTTPISIYVSKDGDDNNDGTSWEKAVKNLTKASELSEVGGVIAIKGDYELSKYSGGGSISKSVNIYGGFKGTEQTIEDREKGAKSKIIVSFYYSTGNGPPFSAALLAYGDNITLNIRDCSFEGVSGGSSGPVLGSMKASNKIVVESCDFKNLNKGAIGQLASCTAYKIEVKKCSFTGNSRYNGGAISYKVQSGQTGNLLVENCSFTNNSCVDSGGAIVCDNSKVKIINCQFSKNKIGSSGKNGGAISMANSNSEILKCDFTENKTEKGIGGAIYSFKSDTLIQNCKFIENKSTAGGAVAIEGQKSGDSTVINSLFYSNEAGASSSFPVGGAIYVLGFDNGTEISPSSSKVVNCTFYDNKAGNTNGGALYVGVKSSSVVYNSIFYKNPTTDSSTPGLMFSAIGDANGELQAGNNAWDAVAQAHNSSGNSSNMGGNILLSTSPFASIAQGSADFLHLASGSPCIKSGKYPIAGVDFPTKDLAGKPRISGGKIDMGCYED